MLSFIMNNNFEIKAHTLTVTNSDYFVYFPLAFYKQYIV